MARRTRLTRPYPVNTLEDVLPISETIQEVNGGQPVPTGLLADALGTTSRSSAFVQKLGSSARYGLTVGSHTSEQIELTDLGESLTAPRGPAERSIALRNAAVEPDIFRRFYEIHSGKPLPEIPYASNTLVRELGVRKELTEECLRIIRLNGLFAGIVTDESGSLVVNDPIVRGDDAQPTKPGPFSALAESEDGTPRTEGEAPYVLVLSMDGDTLADEVMSLIETISIPAKAVHIDAQDSVCIPSAMSAALRSARGCIVIWPDVDSLDRNRLLRTRTWVTVGAASFQLGNRVVIVADCEDDPELALASTSLGLMVVEPRTDGGMFPSLMSALVNRSIVQVSFG